MQLAAIVQRLNAVDQLTEDVNEAPQVVASQQRHAVLVEMFPSHQLHREIARTVIHKQLVQPDEVVMPHVSEASSQPKAST